MALSLFAAPSGEPITVEDAKLHCRVDTNDEDALFEPLIQSAREYVETYTRRALLTQTWDLKLDAFPCDGEAIWLPFPPVSSVTSISYVDTNGTTQTWSSSLYQTDLPSGPQARRARIVPAYAQYYPVARGQMNAVTVRFVCGYGGADDVPAGLIAGMKLLIGHWYHQREPVQVGRIVSKVPDTIDALLFQFRAY